MKTIFTILLNLFMIHLVLSQEKIITVSGNLIDKFGEPMPGVIILEKGTDNGTVTDVKGYYSIDVPVGSILIYNYIGYLPQEIVVAGDMEDKPIHRETLPDNQPKETGPSFDTTYLQLFDLNTKTIAKFTNKSPVFYIQDVQSSKYYSATNINLSQLNFNPNLVNKIKPANKKHVRSYTLETNKYRKNYVPRITYSTSYSIDKVTWVPQLQTTYSQGMPLNGSLQWLGPDNDIPFSWGPELRLLEYDGMLYDYDINGQLVPLGMGNGIHANQYDPLAFFRDGSYFSNKIKLEDKINNLAYNITYHQVKLNGIIPGSETDNHSIGIKVNYKMNGKNINGQFYYNKSKSNLALSGSNQVRLLKSIYLTPPSFDNSNGLNKKAINNSRTWLLDNGEIRSYNPQNAFNPYWLINNILDTEKNDRMIGNMGGEIYFYWGKLDIEFGYDMQNTERKTGINPNSISFENGIFTKRNEKYRSIHNSLIYSRNNHYFYDFEVDWNVGLKVDHNYRILTRYDYEGLVDFNPNDLQTPLFFLDTAQHRLTYLLSASLRIKYEDYIILKIANGNTWSSTLHKKYNGYFNPTLGLNVNVSDLPFRNLYILDRFDLSINSNYTHTLNEAPLHYAFGQYNSLLTSQVNSNQFYEQEEILYNSLLEPEKHDKFNIGINVSLLNNRIQMHANYYLANTKDQIVPYIENSSIKLGNGADVKDKGYEISLYLKKEFYNLNNLNCVINFTLGHSNPRVKKVNSFYENTPIAGFSTIGSYLIENQPLGIIVGSRFLRNDQGQIVIGSNGYPLVDTESGIIGNPNPDFNLGIEGIVTWKNFTLHLLVDMSSGGDVWNGTLSTLNYYGKSQLTADQREVRGYLFEGVMPDGTPNVTPVDFSNPANELNQNRWIRYGEKGVDEESIVDGSYIRFKEAKMEYKANLYNILNYQAFIKIALFGRNLFISDTKGIYPGNTLLNQPEGSGFNYFNLPGTRSYGIAIEMNF